MAVETFTPVVDAGVVEDLRRRLRSTRWPPPAPGPRWAQGTDLDDLRALCAYWADGFDWPAQQARLLGDRHVLVEVDGVRVHALHRPARRGRGVPLVLTHGWPSAFTEYLPVLDLLTDPAGHGLDGPAFDLVLPSLPGYAFSGRPPHPLPYRRVARLWHGLMTALGYRRYGVGGGDFGAGVATFLALQQPDAVLGVHLSTLELDPHLGPGAPPPTPAERAWLDRSAAWWADEGGYKAVQSTRPQTLAYGLTDSPAGLAAWVGEKWRAWADPAGATGRGHDAWAAPDALLTVLTLYWATGCIGPSMRDYHDNRHHPVDLGPDERVRVPTAVALFADPAGDPPREWVERLYDVVRWTPMPRGGHFAATEQPELYARDVLASFADR
jgi:pimeloyl-ACP methyl ester carboxylesterase